MALPFFIESSESKHLWKSMPDYAVIVTILDFGD